MRLGTVRHEGTPHIVAALDDAHLLDLTAVGGWRDMLEIVNGGAEVLERIHDLIETADGRAVLRSEDVVFLPPIQPVQYRDCLVFEEHLINGFKQAEKLSGKSFAIPEVWYKQPIYYKGNRMSFIGHGQNVIWPGYADHLDIELELAIIVGKTGKDITAQEAPDHIFGYSILNDVSARDAQMIEMPGQLGPAKGKDFDTGNILGPFILTADEVAHPVALDMEARVNGQRWGGGNSASMHHDFGAILAHISASETIHAGEVIGSGTVGTGCGLELGKKLEPGDHFELEIEKIGTLANRIVKGG